MLVGDTLAFLSLILGLQWALGEGFCGKDCCQQKKVDGITYFLAYKSQDVHKDCIDGCVYKKENDKTENFFCFGKGNHTVEECLTCKPLPGIFFRCVLMNKC